MRRVLMLGALLTLGLGALYADVVPCPSTATLNSLLAFNSRANACFSQDKEFWNFNYSPGPGAPSASGVNATLIFQPNGAIDIHGWDFAGNWSQNSSGLANFVLGYTIAVCDVAVCSSNVTPGTNIFAADATYAPSVFGAGNEVVTWSTGASATLTQGTPGPLPAAGNIGLPNGGSVGPISVSGNFSGTGTITDTTFRFYETSAVPEPAAIGLTAGLMGLLAIAGFRRRVSSR